MSGGGVFTCEAVYYGWKVVLGAQSSATLTALVDDLLRPHAHHPPTHHPHNYSKAGGSERCQLLCDEEQLRVAPVRKDEGFESDSESSGSACDDPCCRAQDIKVISDHVLRLDQLISHDGGGTVGGGCGGGSGGGTSRDSGGESAGFRSSSSSSSSDEICSSATSSGAESEDDSPRTNPTVAGSGPDTTAQQVNGGGPNKIPGSSSSASGNMIDTFLMSDILYCHVSPGTPRVLVVVVKATLDAGTQVLAHVFQCHNEEAARALYAHYKEASNKYKLDRYRNSKRKNDSSQGDAASANSSSNSSNSSSKNSNSKSSSSSNTPKTSSRGSSSSSNSKPPSGSSRVYSTNSLGRVEGGVRGSLRSMETRVCQDQSDVGNNINVIQIRETLPDVGGGIMGEDGEGFRGSPWAGGGGGGGSGGLVQHTDANGVTHIEIDSGPCSLVSSSSDMSEFSSIISLGSSTQSSQLNSPMNSLTIHPHSNINHSRREVLGSHSSCGGSLRGSRNTGNSHNSNSNSSSCPSSLINPSREVLVAGETDKKFRQRQPALLLRREESSRQEHPVKCSERRSEESMRRSENNLGRGDGSFRRHDKKSKEGTRRDRQREESSGGGGRSRRDWHEGERVSGSFQEVSRGAPEVLIPRPVTTSQEIQPRPRDQSRGRSRTSHNKGPAPPPPPRRHPNNPSLLLVPTKSGSENARAFYPKESHIMRGNKVVRVEVPGYRGAPGGWMPHDVNNNPHHYPYYGAPGAWVGPHEYHSLRSPRESTITPEMRRRSRSKSPARRPMAHRYIDAVSTFSLSQKLRDISDAVFTAKRGGTSAMNVTGSSGGSCGVGGEVKGHQRSPSTVSGADTDGTLKSVIKKGRRQEGSPQCRRVTFSAYATVQVMET